MQSPSRSSRPAPAATSQDFDLGSLKRQLLVRNEEHQYLTRAHNQERLQLEAAAENTQNSIATANAVLVKKQQQLDETERDLAKISAMRNRQLQTKEERLAVVEAEANNRRDAHAQLSQEVRNLQADLADLRRDLAKSQLDVEASRQKQVQASHEAAQLDHHLDKSKERHAAQAMAQQNKQVSLERQLVDLDRTAAAVLESSRRFANTVAVGDAAHQERVTKEKLACDNVRHEMAELQAHITALRKSVSDAQRENEEALRKRRKADEEALAEHVASRKADLQRLRSSRDEQVRLLRAETVRERDALSGQLDTHAQSLTTLRESVNELFDEELRLQATIAAEQESLIGVEVLEQRVTNGRLAIDAFNEKLSNLEDDEDATESKIQDLNIRAQNLTDTVAPLADVEASISQLNHRADHHRNTLADSEANHAIWKVQTNEAESNILATIDKTNTEIEDSKILAKDVESRNEETMISMNGEARVLVTEMEALDAKIAEMKSRNSTLDNTLEHVTRQRRAMVEEANARRDAARLAAATLLAQLE